LRNGEERIEHALRAVGDDYVRRNPPDLLRARTRIEQLRRRRRMTAAAGVALGTAAAVAVAVLAWPVSKPEREAPRPAADLEVPPGAVVIAVGAGPSEVAVGDDAVWVSNSEDQTISRVDPVTNTATRIQLTGTPGDLAAGDAGEVWVASRDLGAVQRIDPVTNAATPDRRVDVAAPGTPLDLAIDEHLWVSVAERELVQVDATTGDVVRRIGSVRPVNVAARDGAVFVLEADGTVRGIDAATGEPTAIELSFEVEGSGDVHLHDGSIWVAEGDGASLYSADVASGSSPIRSFGFRGTYVEMAHTTRGVIVLSELGDGTGILTLIDPDTGDATEVGEVEGGPRDLVRGLGDMWVSAHDAGVLLRIPSPR
jgi:streptogramin lyase